MSDSWRNAAPAGHCALHCSNHILQHDELARRFVHAWAGRHHAVAVAQGHEVWDGWKLVDDRGVEFDFPALDKLQQRAVFKLEKCFRVAANLDDLA